MISSARSQFSFYFLLFSYVSVVDLLQRVLVHWFYMGNSDDVLLNNSIKTLEDDATSRLIR